VAKDNSKNNKRAKQRHDLHFYLKVADSESGKIIGRIVDLTVDGMMLVSDGAWEAGKVHKAKIILTDGLLGLATNDVEVSFTTLWSKPDLNPSLFVNGVKFKDLDAKARNSVEQIIRNISFDKKH